MVFSCWCPQRKVKGSETVRSELVSDIHRPVSDHIQAHVSGADYSSQSIQSCEYDLGVDHTVPQTPAKDACDDSHVAETHTPFNGPNDGTFLFESASHCNHEDGVDTTDINSVSRDELPTPDFTVDESDISVRQSSVCPPQIQDRSLPCVSQIVEVEVASSELNADRFQTVLLNSECPDTCSKACDAESVGSDRISNGPCSTSRSARGVEDGNSVAIPISVAACQQTAISVSERSLTDDEDHSKLQREHLSDAIDECLNADDIDESLEDERGERCVSVFMNVSDIVSDEVIIQDTTEILNVHSLNQECPFSPADSIGMVQEPANQADIQEEVIAPVEMPVSEILSKDVPVATQERPLVDVSNLRFLVSDEPQYIDEFNISPEDQYNTAASVPFFNACSATLGYPTARLLQFRLHGIMTIPSISKQTSNSDKR